MVVLGLNGFGRLVPNENTVGKVDTRSCPVVMVTGSVPAWGLAAMN